MEKILGVDLCDTLYKSNTTQDFFDFMFMNDKNYLILKKKNKKIVFKVLNKLSNKILKKDLSRRLLTKQLKGVDEIEIENKIESFIDDYLEKVKLEQVHEIIKEYKDKGYKVVLISASYDFIGEKVAQKLNLDNQICSKAEIINGKFTGKVSKDLLYTKLEEFKALYSVNDELVMITDNITDYKFVKHLKKAYIVINKRNKKFWLSKANEKFTFLEE